VINKRAVAGLFGILMILMTVQSLSQTFAVPAGGGDIQPSPDNGAQTNLESFRVAVDVQGQGQVCWSGVFNGCTSDSMTLDDTALYVPIGGALTFTATGGSPVWFVDGQITLGPPTITADGLDHTVIAQFI